MLVDSFFVPLANVITLRVVSNQLQVLVMNDCTMVYLQNLSGSGSAAVMHPVIWALKLSCYQLSPISQPGTDEIRFLVSTLLRDGEGERRTLTS